VFTGTNSDQTILSSTTLNGVAGLLYDPLGDSSFNGPILYSTEQGGRCVRRWPVSTDPNTVAQGTSAIANIQRFNGFSDGGPIDSTMSFPLSMAMTNERKYMLISDYDNNQVRELVFNSETLGLNYLQFGAGIASDSLSGAAQDGLAINPLLYPTQYTGSASFSYPSGLASFASDGYTLVADNFNGYIRGITGACF
jgi:hypothetical protein